MWIEKHYFLYVLIITTNNKRRIKNIKDIVKINVVPVNEKSTEDSFTFCPVILIGESKERGSIFWAGD